MLPSKIGRHPTAETTAVMFSVGLRRRMPGVRRPQVDGDEPMSVVVR
jgi:hypothetical protein